MSFVKFKPIASHFRFSTILNKNCLDKEILNLIDEEEKIIHVFKSRRDLGIFTDKRIVLIDKKGFTGFRKSIYSIKYESISSYDLNIHNLDSTIEIITNSSHALRINFLKPIPLVDVEHIYKYINSCVINDE